MAFALKPMWSGMTPVPLPEVYRVEIKTQMGFVPLRGNFPTWEAAKAEMDAHAMPGIKLRVLQSP